VTTQDDVSEAIQRAVPSIGAERADQIAETLIEETWEIDADAFEEALDTRVGTITFDGAGGLGGATSVKLENTTLNLWGFGALAAGGTLGLLTVGTNPILLTLAVAAVFFGGHEILKVKLTDADASVLWAASLVAPGLPVRDEQLFARTNVERVNHSMNPLKDEVFAATVEKLVRAGCFERVGIGTVRLVESVASS
jgi:hypothetical protein